MSNIRGKIFIHLMVRTIGKRFSVCLLMGLLGAFALKGSGQPATPLSTNSPSLKFVPALINSTALQTNTPSASQTSSTNYIHENYDVRRFLEEAPPLRKVVYGLDACLFYTVGESEEDIEAKKGSFVHYEGAWQPGTFYNRVLHDMPGAEYDSGGTERTVVGSNLEGKDWILNYPDYLPQGRICFTDGTNGVGSYSRQQSEMGRSRLDRVRSLWINGMVPGTLNWIDENRFRAHAGSVAAAGAPSNTVVYVTGEITARDAEGRPIRLEYRWPTLQGQLWKEFIYSKPVGGTKLPNVVVGGSKRTLPDGEEYISYTTNMLLSMDIGVEDRYPQGYNPGMFMISKGTNSLPPHILYESNRVSFIVDDTGISPTPEEFRPWEHSWSRRLTLVAVLLMLLIPFFWKYKIYFQKENR
ncbi:MAG: hypothetical protein EOM12_11405 [Verrucomicrobiae bacterium]|nr:hypothetical protein [Verrucomicrobiae bacterium]